MFTQKLNQLLFSRRTLKSEGNEAREDAPVVCLDSLSKSFVEAGRTRVVLDGVDLEIQNGEFVALLGHSGSGKSTLLNLISGIERPSSGLVSINEVPITELRERDRTLFRRDNIGFVFQFFNLIPTLTVLENVTLPRELAGDDDDSINVAAMRLLQLVGLEDRRDTFPDKLSGGEQQRVAIARALVHDPMLVLADEPTGNLDENTGGQVLDLLLSLTRRRGKTLIMATHNPEIARMADRIVRVHDGHLQDETHLYLVEYA
ncbi:MAG: ABC transporter ATP-binding protein [Candidatus Promineifilaceae bacterium]|jgi:putative ABC transport system ATP-binding protein